MADGPTPPDSAEKQLGDIVADVTAKANLLVKEEIELAKAEVAQKAKRLGTGAGLIAVAGAFLLFFLILPPVPRRRRGPRRAARPAPPFLSAFFSPPLPPPAATPALIARRLF